MSAFVMPSLGADMESGKVVEWLVKPGSAVRKGDVVVVVETHKGAIEVEIFEDGVVSELCAGLGDEVPVGGLLANIAQPGAAPQPAPPPPAAPGKAAPAPLPPIVVPQPMPAAGAAARTKVSPVARRRAAALGIDPDTLKGTGIDGSVTLADVELAGRAGRAQAAPPVQRRAGFDPAEMRQAIAAAAARSKREIPHYYLASTVDMGPALAWLAAFNRERAPDERMLPAVLLLKATALALRKVPQLNGFWENGAFRAGGGVHVGWAVSLRGGGLVAPAIHDVDALGLPDLMTALRDLVARARGGGLRSSEFTDPTFTVTSLGERGADSVTGIIYPPQVGILGFGRIAERPWVVAGEVVPRPLVAMSLAADHRASDGHTGGLLLSAVEALLQEPEKL